MKPKSEWLPPEEAVRLMKEDPSLLLLPLTDFMRPGGLTQNELLGELRSGRLVARCDPKTLAGAKIKGKGRAADFTVDMECVIEWMANPETPKYLVTKFKDSIDHKPH